MPDQNTNATGGDNGQGQQNNPDTSNREQNEGQQSATSNDNKQNEGQQTKTFTQDEVNRLLAKERKDAERKAKMSEDERKDVELTQLRSEVRLNRAEKSFTAALGSQVKSPGLLFAAAQGLLEFDTNDKVTNMDDVVKDLKSRYPEQFEIKPSGSADAGQGNNRNQTKSMNDWLRGK